MQDVRIIRISVCVIGFSLASADNADLGLKDSDILLSLI